MAPSSGLYRTELFHDRDRVAGARATTFPLKAGVLSVGTFLPLENVKVFCMVNPASSPPLLHSFLKRVDHYLTPSPDIPPEVEGFFRLSRSPWSVTTFSKMATFVVFTAPLAKLC